MPHRRLLRPIVRARSGRPSTTSDEPWRRSRAYRDRTAQRGTDDLARPRDEPAKSAEVLAEVALLRGMEMSLALQRVLRRPSARV